MGKRELLLIAAFVVVGGLVYQVAAPPGPARERRFSFSRMMESLRRELREDSARAEVTTAKTVALEPGVAELRIQEIARLTVTGERRTDIAAELHVESTGVDQRDAEALARRTRLLVDQSGAIVTMRIDAPREGRQRAELTLRVPKELTIRLEGTVGRADLRDMDNVHLNSARGEITIAGLAGELRGTFQGGRLRVEQGRAIRLTARRSEIEIEKLEGDATLDLSGGSMRASRIGGRLELDANRADVEIDEVGGEVRANVTEGGLELAGVRREARIDGRGTEIAVTLAAAAPLTAFTSGETLTVKLPDAGVTLDATAMGGEIRVSDKSLRVAQDGDAHRLRAAVRGGGPTVSLRVTRGDIVIR